jgi:ABC-type phosphate transport system substrate-binding protein
MWKKILVIALAFSLKISSGDAQDKSGDLAIVVGKARALDSVTLAELTKIFRAEKPKGTDGVRFVILSRDPGSPERAAALADIYSASEDDYAKYFLQATFTGLVQSAPRVVTSPAAVLQFVAITPGAIGYLRASDVDDSVKVLKVDGHAPGEPDYALKIK